MHAMDLKSGYPFWPIANGLIASYPSLSEDLTCDVAIVGGGITGALIAHTLTEAGFDTVVVDRRDVATGSTSASTALLQYEIDTPLSDLIGMVGRDHAVRSYLLCVAAIGTIERLIATLDDDCGFERKRSLYLASRARDVAGLRAEYATRRSYGIQLDYLERAEIEARYSFSAPGALSSAEAAQVDVYRLAHALFRAATARGLRIFDRTRITAFDHDLPAGVALTTDRGRRITARKVVMAAGFESQAYLKRKVGSFRSTYALISEPVGRFAGWEDQCLIWESARPYLYMRTTSDGRVLVGGEDDRFDNEHARDRKLDKKCHRLLRRFSAMFPHIPLEVAYSWAGTFGETKDGLAYIGETPEFPNGYFALGYGGNGITYSVIAAEIICDLLQGRPNRDAEIFRFDR
jgi:glycine/D-amino acid oxidase-like deaminating enzyme